VEKKSEPPQKILGRKHHPYIFFSIIYINYEKLPKYYENITKIRKDALETGETSFETGETT
jgi:hypothetical protein